MNPGAGKTIAQGTYTGNGGAGRQILTGFLCSLVVIGMTSPGAANQTIQEVIQDAGNNSHLYSSGGAVHPVTGAGNDVLHATDGFVVGNGAVWDMNVAAETYAYWAISS